jgi:hypothetical protein
MTNKTRPRAVASARHNKRWFVAASGWGLDLAMGSGETTTKNKRSLATLPPNSHIFDSNGTIAAANFTHNTIYTTNPLFSITQGTGDSNRLGDTIHLDRISLVCQVDTSTATTVSAPVKFRMMLVVITNQYSPTAFTSGVGSTDVFFTTSTGLIVSRPNPRLCKVLCDEIVVAQPMTVAGAALGYGHIDCKIDMPFEFRTGSNYGTTANMYLLLIPNIAGGTSGTTLCGTLSFDYLVSFRDI